jgi:hypothetical protein
VGRFVSPAVHNLVEKFSVGSSKVADDDRAGAGVAETEISALVKRWGKFISVGGGYIEK